MLSAIASVLSLTEDEVIYHPDLLINAFDDEHRILFWNKNCEEYFGIPDDHAIGTILEELFPYTREHPKMKYLETAFGGKTVFVADAKYDRKNGRYSQVLLPLKDGDGKVQAVINLVRTIKTKSDDWVHRLFSSPEDTIIEED